MSEKRRSMVVDTDALVALLNKDDALAGRAQEILERCIAEGVHLIYPATMLVEAVTTFQRKLSQPLLAGEVAKLVREGQFGVAPILWKVETVR
jgi:uncharacterized protein with PIN domain